jgi:hypothetical protein
MTRSGIVATLALAVGLSGALLAPPPAAAQGLQTFSFQLFPNPPFVNCLARFPGDPSHPPQVTVTVQRGPQNDTLVLNAQFIKPGVAFDLFTIQNSNQLADGSPNPNFTNFGLAWYQSDLQANSLGRAMVVLNTILVNQIFGFDPAVTLVPTNTFHVGFWFNDPADAAPCGFAGPPTPFNGDHNAGPLAMISRPDAVSGLGPLCRNPNSTPPPLCNP